MRMDGWLRVWMDGQAEAPASLHRASLGRGAQRGEGSVLIQGKRHREGACILIHTFLS